MNISTTSKGSLAAGEQCVGGVSRGAPPERIFRILARVRYRARLASSSITVAIIMVKRGSQQVSGMGTGQRGCGGLSRWHRVVVLGEVERPPWENVFSELFSGHSESGVAGRARHTVAGCGKIITRQAVGMMATSPLVPHLAAEYLQGLFSGRVAVEDGELVRRCMRP